MKTDPKLAAVRRAQLKILTRQRTQTEVCTLAGLKLPQLGQWLSGDRNMSEASARNIERSLRLPVGWLDARVLSGLDGGSSSEPPRQEDGRPRTELAAGPAMRGKVPLVSWEAAGRFSSDRHSVDEGAAIEWVATSEATSERTFALRVMGDAMSPDFPPGAILIVEPAAEATSGDYVIAKDSSGEPIFRQLVKDGSRWFLRALHPSYPTYDAQPNQVIGVVVEVTRRLKPGA